MANEWPVYLWSCRTAFMVVLRGTEMMYKHVASVRADSEAGDIPRSKLETLSAGLSARIDDFTKVAATPGIKAYAENEFVRLPGFDAAASFTQMLNAMTAVRDWLDGRLAAFPDLQTFTTAQTAQLRTALDALLATMDATPNG